MNTTAGCIDAGLGSPILDCMDDSISWDEKVKRASKTTMWNVNQIFYIMMLNIEEEMIKIGEKMEKIGNSNNANHQKFAVQLE
jgi:hypothetical protein